MTKNDLTIRPLGGREELELFCTFPYALNEELADDLDAGRRRLEWMWIALRDDDVVARLAWWSPAAAEVPALLDVLDVEDSDLAARPVEMLTRLHRRATAATLPPTACPPEFIRFLLPAGGSSQTSHVVSSVAWPPSSSTALGCW